MGMDKISRRETLKLGASGIIVAAFPSLALGLGNKPDAAKKAYNLRMQGKVDEAKTLLEGAISDKPDSAAAHYELGRIQLHMALGQGGRAIIEKIGDAQETLHKALALDSSNFIHTFFTGHVDFFQAYYAQMTGGQPQGNRGGTFEAALQLRPDFLLAMLYLVELNTGFPEEAGGDRSKAEHYARRLEGMEDVFGSKARAMLLPAEVDRVDYWQQILKRHEGNAYVMEELGKAYLRADNVEKAVYWFEQAIAIEPEKASLFLDLSIYHTFKGMSARDNKELQQTHVTLGDAAVTRYIASEPIQPMLAYALGVQFKYKMFTGDQEQGHALLKRAETLDPYFSKATVAPHPDLFIPPGEVSQNHRYLMRPF